jgi:hypothetical protein
VRRVNPSHRRSLVVLANAGSPSCGHSADALYNNSATYTIVVTATRNLAWVSVLTMANSITWVKAEVTQLRGCDAEPASHPHFIGMLFPGQAVFTCVGKLSVANLPHSWCATVVPSCPHGGGARRLHTTGVVRGEGLPTGPMKGYTSAFGGYLFKFKTATSHVTHARLLNCGFLQFKSLQ